jgi:hypothetical protein
MIARRTLNGLTARTLRDAGRDPFDALECAHRSHWLMRWWRPAANLLAVVLMFGFLGALLAWGGRGFP